MWWFVVIMVVAAIAAAYAVSPKTPEQKPATLSDLNVPTAEQGRPIPVVFGTYLIQSPNVVWYGDLAYKKVKAKGGK
jgi:hypothetical protein